MVAEAVPIVSSSIIVTSAGVAALPETLPKTVRLVKSSILALVTLLSIILAVLTESVASLAVVTALAAILPVLIPKSLTIIAPLES